MGVSGDDFIATMYVCNFKGEFELLEKIDKNSYKVKLVTLESEKPDGEMWIEDEVRYIASTPYGIDGGDEFILFIYGCQTEKELQDYIQLIEKKRDRMVISFDNQEVKVRYSMGYAFFKDQNTDYEELIREADDNMYVDKKSRKKQA